MAFQFIYTVSAASGTQLGLWETTGSRVGTPDAVVVPYAAGTFAALGFSPGYAMARLGSGQVVFATRSTSSNISLTFVQGLQLWVTDGTAAGTRVIGAGADFQSGQANDPFIFAGFTAYNNIVLFEQNIGATNQNTLLATDGTNVVHVSSAYNLDDASIGSGNGISIGTRFIYASSFGVFATNGTAGSENLLKQSAPGNAASIGFLAGHQMAALSNGTVIFGATSNGSTASNEFSDGVQLWATDGTAAGTRLVSPHQFQDLSFGQPNSTAGLSGFISIGTRVLFMADLGSSNTRLLYSTDGTDGGLLSTSVSPDADSFGPGRAASTGSKVIWADQNGVWSSDGTGSGTILLKALNTGTPTATGFVPGKQMATLPDGRVVFGATATGSTFSTDAFLNGIQLWVTDGTVAGTQRIFTQIDPGTGGPTDTDRFWNFVSTGNGVQFLSNVGGPNKNTLYFTDGTNAGTYPISNQIVDDKSQAIGLGASPVCFLPGTMIMTPAGEVAIEALSVGDPVTTVSGVVRFIRWVGRGQVLATRGKPNAATPVIVRKGAFADNVPNADLRVTKAHAFYIGGVLMPVEFLINHRTIRWDRKTGEVALFHIELETHDAILANGAPAETYRDDGNRWMFGNSNTAWHKPPMPAFAPVATGGPAVDAAWTRFLERAGPIVAPPMTDDPDVHLLVDGQRIDVARSSGADRVFRVPERPRSVRIVSRSVVPAELGLMREPRCLGVAIRRIALWRGRQHAAIDADDARLEDGFHGYEPAEDYRWTDGDGHLPIGLFDGFESGTVELTVTLGGTTRYAAPRPRQFAIRTPSNTSQRVA